MPRVSVQRLAGSKRPGRHPASVARKLWQQQRNLAHCGDADKRAEILRTIEMLKEKLGN